MVPATRLNPLVVHERIRACARGLTRQIDDKSFVAAFEIREAARHDGFKLGNVSAYVIAKYLPADALSLLRAFRPDSHKFYSILARVRKTRLGRIAREKSSALEDIIVKKK